MAHFSGLYKGERFEELVHRANASGEDGRPEQSLVFRAPARTRFTPRWACGVTLCSWLLVGYAANVPYRHNEHCLIRISTPRRNRGTPVKKTVGKACSVPYYWKVKRRDYIYRRRRLAVLFLTAVVSCILYAGAPASAGRSPAHHAVVPGETLWSIAIGHYPSSEDPREIIEDIRQTNGLEGYQVQSGERLELPPLDS